MSNNISCDAVKNGLWAFPAPLICQINLHSPRQSFNWTHLENISHLFKTTATCLAANYLLHLWFKGPNIPPAKEPLVVSYNQLHRATFCKDHLFS